LRRLNGDAQCDAPLKALIENATTPEPLRPALIRALVDAWSMTSLEIHTGRPEVAPWLRGWVEETPQTTIAWRTHLPVRVDDRGRALPPDKTEIGEFFEAAPPHQSEKLETETYRVADWLQKRAEALFERKQPSRKQDVEGEAADGEAQAEDNLDAAEIESEQGVPQSGKLQRDDIVALILSPGNAYTDRSTLRDLAQERKGDAKKEFEKKITGKILVVDARFGGLKDGLLDADSDFLPETADTSAAWSEQAQFRVTEKSNLDVEALAEERAEGWRFEDDFVLRRDGEGSPLEWLTVEHFRDAAQREDARAISKPQELTVHQDWARNEMLRIAEHVGLSDIATNALAIGAGLHDEGKRAPRWQRAFRAPRIKEAKGKYKIFAKTRGPIDQAILGGYRHEFGSLSYVEESAEFRALPEDWRDLVLHLVAAHHGQARPVIETRGCEDPPSLLEARARAVALRFARLQKQWGPWGLAWWEALLRAADQRASRRLEDES
jgi:CRISPR-associated endonuclease/helicase Cas3